MSVLSDHHPSYAPHAGVEATSSYFGVLLASLLLLNFSTFLYHLTAAPVFNVLSNSIGLVVIAYSMVRIVRSSDDDATGIGYLFFAIAALAPTLLVHFTVLSVTDVVKYISPYIIYVAARRSKAPFRKCELYALYGLAALPIVFMAIGTSKVYGSVSVGFLPNANTAVLYFTAILFAAAPFLGSWVFLLQILNAVLMNRIGALVGTIVAITIWIAFPIRKETIIGAALVIVAGVVAMWFGALDRAMAAFDSFTLMLSLEPSAVLSMSYGDLVQLTGSVDLSGLFRLIHWSEILHLYATGGPVTWLFGYGPGQTVPLTHEALIPHNDYLRVLAEYGICSFVVFVCFLVHVGRGLQSGPVQVLFLVLCIYFFSENLLDNFTSMALFFGFAGRMAAQESADAEVKRQRFLRVIEGGLR